MKDTSKESEHNLFTDELNMLKEYLIRHCIELKKAKVIKAAKILKIPKKIAMRYYDIMRVEPELSTKVGYESVSVKIDRILKRIKKFYRKVKQNVKQ